MMNSELRRKHLGSLLVGLQFGLIGLLALSVVPVLRQGRLPATAALLAVAGLALAVWALWAYPPGRFNIRPTPRANGQVVQRGPYRWIRHPMYSSIALCGLACACAAQQAWLWLALVALLLVLLTKALLEERWMAQQHPDYAEYQARTQRFVPWLL
jgi:protein-S-isoprenylcysteine O-methyltransferase Ste14